jgi:hypothetical protein
MVARQFKVIVNGADPYQSVIIRVNVVQEARPGQFLGAESAAFFDAFLEDPDAPSRLGKIGSERHSIVTRTYDDRIKSCIGHRKIPLGLPAVSLARDIGGENDKYFVKRPPKNSESAFSSS